MASFRLRAGIWQARVKIKGFPEETKSFGTKADAQHWAREIESAMYRGVYLSQTAQNELLLTDILMRYLKEVTPTKRSAQRELESITFMHKFKMVNYSMAKLTPAVIADYRDQRLKTVAAGTILRELSILSSIINHARKEWGVTIENPCQRIRKPTIPIGRSRLLTDSEEEALIRELQPRYRRSPLMVPIIRIALETAMRRGEILALRWENIDLVHQTALLPITKNGTARIVPLSSKAIRILTDLGPQTQGIVFPMSHMVLHNCFTHACQRAGIKNLHFHDLRHTATSRIADKLPNVIELASVTGHQTIQMLKRYYHPKAEVLAKKLG